MLGLEKEELKVLRALNTPVKIQEFLNQMKINFEKNGDTCMSPRRVLRKRECHCIEGAMLAALAFRINGEKPLIVDLTANNQDDDHVIAVFKRDGKWGAISKTNHSLLRYRDPVYNSIRELVMSFFNEYFNDDGKKTLRSFSMPVDLSRFDKFGWMISEEDVWYVPDYLVKVKHFPVLNRKQIMGLRKAEDIEIKASDIEVWEEE